MPETAKTRQTGLFTGGLKVGASGSPITKLLVGTFIAAVPQFTASGITVPGTVTVAGLESGMRIITQPTSSCGIFMSSASVTADNTISASYGIADHAATGGTCNITFQYLAWKE